MTLRERLADHFAVVDGRAPVAAIMEEGQFQVIEGHQVRDGRADVMDMARTVQRAQANFIG